MEITKEINKRLMQMSSEGFCVECMEHPITHANSSASKCARELGLCRRCYDKKDVRNRWRRRSHS